MPLRRRRDGSPIRVRAEEPSSARARVPIRNKAPRSLRRWRSSRSGIRGRSRPAHEGRGTPTLASDRAGDPGARSATRRARATFVQSARKSLRSSVSGPRRALSTQVERSARTTRRGVACTSWLAGFPYGNVWASRRNRHRLVPACSGVKAPLACEGRMARRVCPRVDSQVAEVGGRRPRLRET